MAPAPAPMPSPRKLIKMPAITPPVVSSVWVLTPVLLTIPHCEALIDPTMMVTAMIVPTAEIKAPTRPAMVAAPMVPPARAVMKPAPPMSPRKTRNARKPRGEPRRQGAPLVAPPIQFKSSVTTADATPNLTAFPDQPFMNVPPGLEPIPESLPVIFARGSLVDKHLIQVEDGA